MYFNNSAPIAPISIKLENIINLYIIRLAVNLTSAGLNYTPLFDSYTPLFDIRTPLFDTYTPLLLGMGIRPPISCLLHSMTYAIYVVPRESSDM